MKKSSVLVAALVLTLASAVMAAGTETLAHAETDTNSPVLLVHEKSQVSTAIAPPETAAAGGCCACPPDPTVTGDIYIGPSNKYIFRGNSLSPNNAAVIQGGIDLTYKEFTLSTWTNAQTNNTGYRKAKVTENDLILDYAVPYRFPFAPTVGFNVGTQYFALDGVEDTNEFYLKASLPEDTLLKPTLQVYWDNLQATRAGLYYTFSVSHKFELEHKVFNLNLGALVGYNQRNPNAAVDANAVAAGLSNGRDGVYNGWQDYELTASIDYTPTNNITISPSYQFSDALSGHARSVGITDQNVFALKVAFSF